MTDGMKYLTAEDIERALPGYLADLAERGVELSNNAGAIIVDGYLGDIIAALFDAKGRDCGR